MLEICMVSGGGEWERKTKSDKEKKRDKERDRGSDKQRDRVKIAENKEKSSNLRWQ